MSTLFSEISIRNIRIKNRIVMPPMVCFGVAGDDGKVTEWNIKHYQARAKGGVGLIIVEATCVDKSGRLATSQLGLWSDDQIEGFSKIAQACHQYGARVLVQVHHAGLATAKGVTGDIVAPSDFKGKSNRARSEIAARALTIGEINGLQDKFVAAAMRAKTAGLDGVELHGAHGYLISQFLSPLVNKRTDIYGGSIAKRTRFAIEVIKGIRKAAGEDFIIGCRMGCNEPDLESSIEIARRLEKAGLDLLHVSTGMTTFLGMDTGEAPQVPEDFKYNWIVYGGTEIKKNVNIPVIVVNGIRTPEQASYLVENGLADFTALGKGLLIDPEWANKARQNKEVIPCIDCKVCAYFRPGASCPQIQNQ
jgi:NADPH2 dehydrogenase